MTEFLSNQPMAQLSSMISDDEHYMTLALTLAKQGEFTTRPNPCVGCVLVKDGKIIGQGYHPKAGEPHAEVFALKDAKNNGHDTLGATAYVTLEPCSHTGKTPPCADALIQAGIGRVVVAVFDPNPKVAGQGVARLQRAGISVVVGVCQDQAKMLNVGFLKAMATGLPYVRLKMGISLDARVAMASGESKWITSELARADVQTLRAKSAAIITGSGTIIADNPALTVRLPDVVLDNIGKTAIPPPKIIVVDRSAKIDKNSDYQVLKNKDTLIWQGELLDLLKTLVADYQCYDVLVETGATLATSFLNENLVDELIIYQAPCLLGATARPMFLGQFDSLVDKLDFTLVSVDRLGDDIKLVLTKKLKN